MLIRRPIDIRPSEITEAYVRRRELLSGAAALGLGAGLAQLPAAPAMAAALPAAKSPVDGR